MTDRIDGLKRENKEMSFMGSTTLSEIPNFFSGIASIFDFGGTMLEFNVSETDNDADEEAIRHDVHVVAGDMRIAMKKYEKETERCTA